MPHGVGDDVHGRRTTYRKTTEAALLRGSDPDLLATLALVHGKRAAVRARVHHLVHEARLGAALTTPECFRRVQLVHEAATSMVAIVRPAPLGRSVTHTFHGFPAQSSLF